MWVYRDLVKFPEGIELVDLETGKSQVSESKTIEKALANLGRQDWEAYHYSCGRHETYKLRKYYKEV